MKYDYIITRLRLESPEFQDKDAARDFMGQFPSKLRHEKNTWQLLHAAFFAGGEGTRWRGE